MRHTFLNAVKDRRSIYTICNASPISDDKIIDLINESVKHAPTAFNSQSGRVIVLLGNQHALLWDITKETLRKIVPAEAFSSTEQKVDAFKAGYGTVLFFEDQNTVEKLQKDYSLYADKFPVWSDQSSGMLQFIVWTLLNDNGLGATLQHYNPLIDEEVKRNWNVDLSWKLVAQMPFGQPVEHPGPKEYIPLEKRVKVFK